MSTMTVVVILSIIIVLVILALSVVTINKGYSYKHTIDPPQENNIEETRVEK